MRNSHLPILCIAHLISVLALVPQYSPPVLLANEGGHLTKGVGRHCSLNCERTGRLPCATASAPEICCTTGASLCLTHRIHTARVIL